MMVWRRLTDQHTMVKARMVAMRSVQFALWWSTHPEEGQVIFDNRRSEPSNLGVASWIGLTGPTEVLEWCLVFESNDGCNSTSGLLFLI